MLRCYVARVPATLIFSVSGEDQFPSVGYWPLGAPSLRLAARGANPDDGFTAYQRGSGRWGDYSAAAADEYGALWFAAEYTNTLGAWHRGHQ